METIGLLLGQITPTLPRWFGGFRDLEICKWLTACLEGKLWLIEIIANKIYRHLQTFTHTYTYYRIVFVLLLVVIICIISDVTEFKCIDWNEQTVLWTELNKDIVGALVFFSFFLYVFNLVYMSSCMRRNRKVTLVGGFYFHVCVSKWSDIKLVGQRLCSLTCIYSILSSTCL